MSPEASQCLTELQALVKPEMGWYLVFPDHEDGGELEPFVWDGAEQGDFTVPKLVRANGWLQSTPVETVLANWQKPEQVGAVSGDEMLVPGYDRAKILLSPAQREARVAIYQQLWALIEAQVQELQAFQLSSDTDYALTILLGQLPDQTWISLAPAVPIATSSTPSPIQPPAQDPEILESMEADSPVATEIQTLLNRLGEIRIYGYYGGGYDQTHPYYLVQTVGQSADQALEQIMQQTGLLSLRPFESLQPTLPDDPGWASRFERLRQFLQQQFSQMQIYQFSFWNQEQVYLVGAAASDCWGGLHLRSQFIYNP